MILLMMAIAYSMTFQDFEAKLAKTQSLNEKIKLVKSYKKLLVNKKAKKNAEVYYDEEYLTAMNYVNLEKFNKSNCSKYENKIRSEFSYRDNKVSKLHSGSQDAIRTLKHLCK